MKNIRLRYTLIADGSSDKTLLNVIKWLLNDLFPQLSTKDSFADFRNFPNPPKKLKEKVEMAERAYPFDILFVHRDAEKNESSIIMERINEVKEKVGDLYWEKTICIVPVKMMETWFLIDAEAIKKAAGNRNPKGVIKLPSIKQLEKEKQPKDLLIKLIEEASGLKGRQLNKLKATTSQKVHLVAENIEDYSPLRNLEAFQIFETDLKEKVSFFIESKKEEIE